MEETKISSGSFDLDSFLSGGYEKDIITTIYGPAGSGKTNLCMLSATTQAKKGNKVIFIDTEGGFSIDRFKQLAGENYKESIKNIILLKPTSFGEQKKSFETLLKEIKENSNIKLIVIDGMTMLYRLEIGDEKLSVDKNDNSQDINIELNIKKINRDLATQMRTLSEIARNKLIPVIVTNQIYYSFLSEEDFYSGKERTANLVGGDILKYWSKCLLELKNDDGKRKAILKKHRSLPEKELAFTIDNQGIKKKGFF